MIDVRTLGQKTKGGLETVRDWWASYQQWSEERYERDLQRRRALLAQWTGGAEEVKPAEEGGLLLNSPRKVDTRPGVPLPQVGLLDGLQRLMDEQALIVLGPKGSGKSTLASALLNAVIAAGHHVAIIDPHAELNSWPTGLTAYGSGLDYEEIDRVLLALFGEMKLRYQRGQERRRTPLYVFVDEVPSIRDECPAWGRVFAKLLREARKVNIHLVVLSQSFLVEDLGINGDTRTNLTVVALGNAVARYTSKAPHLTEREKQAVIAMARGQRRPAIIDNGDLPTLFEVEGANRINTHTQPRPWAFNLDEDAPVLNGRSSVRSFASESLLSQFLAEDPSDRASERDEVLEFLVEAARAGLNRDNAVKAARTAGYRFSTAEYNWAEVKRLAAEDKEASGGL